MYLLMLHAIQKNNRNYIKNEKPTSTKAKFLNQTQQSCSLGLVFLPFPTVSHQPNRQRTKERILHDIVK
jgi:hypothetical protein